MRCIHANPIFLLHLRCHPNNASNAYFASLVRSGSESETQREPQQNLFSHPPVRTLQVQNKDNLRSIHNIISFYILHQTHSDTQNINNVMGNEREKANANWVEIQIRKRNNGHKWATSSERNVQNAQNKCGLRASDRARYIGGFAPFYERDE